MLQKVCVWSAEVACVQMLRNCVDPVCLFSGDVRPCLMRVRRQAANSLHRYRNVPSRNNIAFWASEGPETCSYQPLQTDSFADVCVVGAGIAGLSIAYMLAREGRSVMVLDDGAIGSGETGRSTAHLSNALDDRYHELERLLGREGARLAAASHTAAIDAIESIVEAEQIDCDFERLDGYLFSPPGTTRQELEEERLAALRAGIAVEWIDRAPIRSFDTGPSLRFSRQGQ